jgi:radical SAM enzyme (TIGR01210 family)
VIVEDERGPDGAVARAATVFLTGRECPWRCTMCDLWKYTTVANTPVGAIPRQLDQALAEIGPDVRTIKLYNAGSFFDPRAVPEADYPDIASRLARFSRVVVESHPALVGPRLDLWKALLPARLEVAMGLETAHPEALAQLNKGMTVYGFQQAARELRVRGVDLRVFLLAPAPGVPPAEQEVWILRSLELALECGASVVSLIPLRGAEPPRLQDLLRWFAASLAHARGRARVFLDLWDLEGSAAHRGLLQAMNHQQAACRP